MTEDDYVNYKVNSLADCYFAFYQNTFWEGREWYVIISSKDVWDDGWGLDDICREGELVYEHLKIYGVMDNHYAIDNPHTVSSIRDKLLSFGATENLDLLEENV